jgi:hypothetical protein
VIKKKKKKKKKITIYFYYFNNKNYYYYYYYCIYSLIQILWVELFSLFKVTFFCLLSCLSFPAHFVSFYFIFYLMIFSYFFFLTPQIPKLYGSSTGE